MKNAKWGQTMHSPPTRRGRVGNTLRRPRIGRGRLILPLLALVCSIVPLGPADIAVVRPDQIPSTTEAEELFLKRVLPLLQEKCLACHGNHKKKLQGKLDLRTRAGMRTGGQSGQPALVPGQAEKSPLYTAVTRQDKDLVMPPKENDSLSPEQVEWIRRWIAAGAPWPDPAQSRRTAAAASRWDNADGVTVRTSGGRSPEWTNRKYRPEDIWAYQPARRPVVPEVAVDPARIRNPVDSYLQEKLTAKGIHRLAPPADKRTLIRRAAFDLTGLPPTPEEIDAFLKDISPDAFSKLVERLLANPHYGEQQARHWLDVVRYADTSGFANDFERPSAWRYRDYVARSFNGDKPFDRFITEQLAGDELSPNDPEMLIAVGFLRMGPWEHTGMSVAAVTRQDFLDDVTHSVGVSFLGQALRCARCHDHKFDPVPTKDYYRLQAVFAPTQFAERAVPFLQMENTSGFTENRALVELRLRKAKDEANALRRKSDEAIATFLKEHGVAGLTDLPPNDRPLRERYGLSDLELSLIRILRKRIDYFERELLRFQPYALTVYNGPLNSYTSTKSLNPFPAQRQSVLPVVHILPGGSLETPGEAVAPGVLSVINASVANDIPQTAEGRRLALARWIAGPDNSLTARVIVNRVWQQHFGKGLVATPNNFGKMGKRPTHPALLDWLALWFTEHDWSLKQLHRLIVTSAAYQQSGQHPEIEELKRLDPNNELLAYFPPRRLASEELRDAMLAVSGELNPEIGGPGLFPEINWEVALQPRHIMGSVARAYQPSPTPRQRNRRTLYAFRYRNLSDPMQEVFNRPGTETSCERRDETTVTPQVFALFNGQFTHDRALALAAAAEKQAGDLNGRVQQVFRRCYGRAPTADEAERCRAHIEKMTAYHRDHPPTPVALPTRVHRKMVEEMTGEEFEWEEELEGMKNYRRDLKPWNVGPSTRALADLCLVLLNSNEFLYVR
jgi:hypothetical protein